MDDALDNLSRLRFKVVSAVIAIMGVIIYIMFAGTSIAMNIAYDLLTIFLFIILTSVLRVVLDS